MTRVERIRLALAELVTPAITRADVLFLLRIADAALGLANEFPSSTLAGILAEEDPSTDGKEDLP